MKNKIFTAIFLTFVFMVSFAGNNDWFQYKANTFVRGSTGADGNMGGGAQGDFITPTSALRQNVPNTACDGITIMALPVIASTTTAASAIDRVQAETAGDPIDFIGYPITNNTRFIFQTAVMERAGLIPSLTSNYPGNIPIAGTNGMVEMGYVDFTPGSNGEYFQQVALIQRTSSIKYGIGTEGMEIWAKFNGCTE